MLFGAIGISWFFSAQFAVAKTPMFGAKLLLLYREEPLDGKTFALMDPMKSMQFQLVHLHAKYTGRSASNDVVHGRLYFSEKMNSVMPRFWIPTESDDPHFASAFSFTSQMHLGAGDAFNFEPAFYGGPLTNSTSAIKAKLKCYYGADAPAEASFAITKVQ